MRLTNISAIFKVQRTMSNLSVKRKEGLDLTLLRVAYACHTMNKNNEGITISKLRSHLEKHKLFIPYQTVKFQVDKMTKMGMLIKSEEKIKTKGFYANFYITTAELYLLLASIEKNIKQLRV